MNKETRHMLDNQKILALLPHKPPFRFLDQVSRYLPGRLLEAQYNSAASDCLFKNSSRVPETILIEGLAQAAVLLTQLETNPLLPGEVPLLGSVKASLYKQVLWGEQINYLVKPVRILEKQAILTGEIQVSDETVVSTLLSVAVAQNKANEDP